MTLFHVILFAIPTSLILFATVVSYGMFLRTLINGARKKTTSVDGKTLALAILQNNQFERISVRTIEGCKIPNEVALGATPAQVASHYDSESAQILLQSRDAEANATADAVASTYLAIYNNTGISVREKIYK